ncbi:MAG TPA: MmgE/PrpD family protein [Burkholderiales bacterium]|nr:MmgE/PrpD family protein [Burkholderiales bacterium]
MDRTTQKLASYVASLTFEDLPATTVHQAKRRLIDSIGCAIGGYDSEPARIARALAAEASSTPAGRILGSGASTSIEMAAFANTCAIRYLDCNDTFISIGSGHPSDMMGALLAVAEARGCSGRDALLAIVIAYEVFTAFADAVPLRDLGWDQGVFVVAGAAAGAAKLLGLSEAQAADAIAIAITANIPTRQTRAGELAMWKGVATAAAARSGVFAALLAEKGMTGPTAAFEGKNGLWEQVTRPFELRALGGKGTPGGIERTNLKFFPSEYHSQAPLFIALGLRERVRVEDIEAIDVQTYWTAYSEIGSEPEKWSPRTRETADHSLPYLLALGFIEGRVGADSFSDERIADARVNALMHRIRIAHNESYTAEFPGKLMTRIEVTTRGGERLVGEASYPKGHAKNPMSDADVEAKLAGLCAGLMEEGARKAMVEALWAVDSAASVADVLARVRVV